MRVRGLAVGVCGTDHELIEGRFGRAPEGSDELVLGHESLGLVLEAPSLSGFEPGELVVGIVRHPDPLPCESCAAGEWDMCTNGLYTERGILASDGFAAEEWLCKPEFLVKVDPAAGEANVLLEPASVLAKAWEQIERIGARAHWAPRRVLVTGAGPIGLLAALMGIQRSLEVHVYDHNESGPKPALARDLGAAYHARLPSLAFDVVIECTGVPAVVAAAIGAAGPDGIVCLAGLGGEAPAPLQAGELNRSLVLGNRVVFGTVNANRRHYEAAAVSLARAGRAWIERLVTRKVPLERWSEAYERRHGDVKTVLVLED